MERTARMLAVAVIGFAFWFVLSGSTAPLTLGIGALSALAVAWWNRDLELLSEALRWSPRFIAYLPWLLKEIWLSAIAVMKVVLDPKLPVDPTVVTIPTALRGGLTRTTFANSITLTPGTITIDVDGGTFLVHAITRDSASGLEVESSEMLRRVAAVFGERAR
jgi:multicomponent Na+:H+ antiporter subunit E